MGLNSDPDNQTEDERSLVIALDDYVDGLVWKATNDLNCDNPHTLIFFEKIMPMLLKPLEESVLACIDLYARNGLKMFDGKPSDGK